MEWTHSVKMKRHDKYYVYILECSDGTFYTGYTRDLVQRIALHNKGNGAKYLKGRKPLKIVYLKEYRYYKNALNEERRIKALPRKQKEKLVKSYTEANVSQKSSPVFFDFLKNVLTL